MFLRHKGIDPPEARLVERTAVLTEEQQHARLVRLKHHKAARQNDRREEQQHAHHCRDGRGYGITFEIDRPSDRRDSSSDHHKDHKQRCKTIHFPARVSVVFVCHNCKVFKFAK